MVARWVGIMLVAGLLAGCAGADAPVPAAPPAAPPPAASADPAAPLTELVGACLDGDLAGCDELFEQSPAGSAEELVGDTCGGRQVAGTGVWCVDAPAVQDGGSGQASVEPVGQGAVLLAACLEGDDEACDELYRGADPGTAARVVGDTCGGRQLAGTGRWCSDDAQRPPDEELVPIGPDEALAMIVWCVDGDLDVCDRLPLDPGLYRLLDDCVNGDSEACDLLLIESSPGSLEELVGETCGGREPLGSGVWCVDAEFG